MQRGVFPFCLEATSQAVVGGEGEALLHRLPPLELFLFISPSLSLFVYTWQLSLLFDSTRLWETMMSCSVVDSGCRFGHADGLQ